MEYTFEFEELTCVNLEQLLNLNRGDIKQIAMGNNIIKVVVNDVVATPSNKQKLADAIQKYGLHKGKMR